MCFYAIVSGPVEPRCFHCQDVELEALSSSESVRFFRCPSCGRELAQAEGGGLTHRWLNPISLVLYPIIFSMRPQDEAERVAGMFLEGRTVANAPEELKRIVEDIREELARPKQRVREILPLHCEESVVGEADVRDYLRRFADLVEDALARK